MQILQQANIPCQETAFTDPNGDILILNSTNTESTKRLIRALQQANPNL